MSSPLIDLTPTPGKLRHTVISSLLGFGLIAGILVYADLSVSQVLDFQLHPGYVVAYLVTVVAYTVIRAIRLRVMLGLSPKTRLAGALYTQATVRDLLPGWVGEPTLMWLLKRWTGIEFSDSASAIFIYRYVEISLYAYGFVVAAAASVNLAPPSVGIAIGLVVSMLLALPPLVRLSPTLRGLVAKLEASSLASTNKSTQGGTSPGNLLKRTSATFGRFLHQFIRSSGAISKPSVYFSALLLTLLGVFTLITGFFFVIRAIDPDAGFLFCAIVFALQFPVSILPLRAIANIGTHELGWVYALLLLGLSQSDAAALALQAHLVFLIGTVFKGLCAVIFRPPVSTTDDSTRQ